MKKLILAAMMGLAGSVFADKVDLSQYKWAVIGDSISDPGHPSPANAVTKYYHYIARDTGIQVVYTNAVGGTGYKKTNGAKKCFYQRLQDDPIPSDVDVVTVFGSINDWSLVTGGAVGSPTDDIKTSDTLSAHMNAVIDLVKAQAPKAKLVLVSGIYYGNINDTFQSHPRDALKAVAEARGIEFHDWLTEDKTDPLDFHHIAENPWEDGSFASRYTIDWGNTVSTHGATFGHPNDLYNETWLAPKFTDVLVQALTGVEPQPTVSLDDPTARPSTNYNGSAVSVSFTGEIPDGASVSAKVTLGGVDYVGTITDSTASFTLPADVVTAGNVYDGTITVTVGDKNYTKDVTLAQGTFKVDEDADWICESAAALDATGTWTGDKVAATDGKIEVSNAVFTAANPSVAGAVVTIDSTFDFVGPNEDPFAASDLAGVKVVKVGKVNRYAFLTGSGVVTNLDATANVKGAVAVKTVIDFGANTIVYTIGDAEFGPYSGFASASSVSGVSYAGGTKVVSLDGAYRYEGLDTNLAAVAGVEYATVAEAVAAGKGGVELLWDTTWEPSATGDYTFTKNGFTLAIGGPLAYSVKDNGDGTVTVTVTGGETPDAPSAASITIVGNTVKVGVADAQANFWYALEKTTDLTKEFVVDATTWTKGSDLLAGDSELVITLGGTDSQAFYRVVVSATAP